MKKALKITGIVLGVILLLLIILCCFPWVFTSGLLEKKFPNINMPPMTEYELTYTDVPEDWVAVTIDGVTVRGPEEYIRSEDASELLAFKGDGFAVGISSAEDMRPSEESMNKIEKFADKRHKRMYKKLGYDENEAYGVLMLEAARNMTLADYKKFMGIDAAMFWVMAKEKEMLIAMDPVRQYIYIDGKKCFICEYHGKNNDSFNYTINYCVGNSDYTVIIKSKDKELAQRCIASIDLPD